MSHKQTIKNLFILFFFITGSLFANRWELNMKVMNSQGRPIYKPITLYKVTTEITGNIKLIKYRDGHSINGPSWAYYGLDSCNVICDIDDSNTINPTPTWDPIEHGRYYIKIDNNYCDIDIPYAEGGGGNGADFLIEYNDGTGTFTNVVVLDHRGVEISGNYTWSSNYSITVKNSFGSGGDIKFDGATYTDIPAAGKSFPENAANNPMEASTFPHYVEAINDQYADGYHQKFNDFGGLSGDDNQNVRSISNPSSGTVTANFGRGFDVTFVNDVVSLGNVGTLQIGGQTKTMPVAAEYVEQGNSITATSTSFAINGIYYVIDHWGSNPADSFYAKTFYPTSHETITVHYKGIPQMTPISINTNEPGENVELTWSSHPNEYVTQYRIYRGAKVDGNFTNPEIIGTVGSSVTSFTDYEYIIGGPDPNSVAYDVVPYYSTEGNWGVVGMNIVSATPFWKIPLKNGEVLTNYSISNYPNLVESVRLARV